MIALSVTTEPELYRELEEYLQEEIEHNYKIVSFYKLDQASIVNFAAFYNSLKVDSLLRYPLVMNSTMLPVLPQRQVVVHVYQSTDFTRIVLTRRREFALRKKIDRTKLAEDAQAALTIYDEVYGVAVYNWQNYDTITLHHKSNILEVRADYTRAENSYQNSTQIDTSLGETVGWLTYESALNKTPVKSGSPINLFPAISHFTHKDDGYISKLHFRTPQGSVKQDTMKRGEDLRKEVFHSAGMSATGNAITPFDISIIWHVENKFGTGQEVELTIPSSLAIASSGSDAQQSYAILKYCSTESDARLLVDKLLGALPDDA